jgi:hypothetical protein
MVTVAKCSGKHLVAHAQISGGDMIGAQLEAADSFRVWYCPLRSGSSGNKRRRKLCKTGMLR